MKNPFKGMFKNFKFSLFKIGDIHQGDILDCDNCNIGLDNCASECLHNEFESDRNPFLSEEDFEKNRQLFESLLKTPLSDEVAKIQNIMNITKKKYGFDLHGVLDNGETYKELAKQLLQSGHDVYLITGTMKGDVLDRDLEKNDIIEGIHFNKFFSVSDKLISDGHVPTFVKPGNPYFDDEEAWNRTKGYFCRDERIDLHFDDTYDYAKYFETPIVIVQK